MADTKISVLASVAPTIDDVIPYVDLNDTTTKKATFTMVKDLFTTFFQSVLVSGTNIKSINSNSILGSGNINIVPLDNYRGGILDYNDTLTTSTPISIPGTSTFTNLTNNGLGAFTNKTYAPIGLTDVWDTTANRFFFSGMKLGDQMGVRLDLEVTISSVNTEVQCDLFMAEGTGFEYQIPTLNTTNYKNTGTYRIVAYTKVYMGDTNTLNNFAKFKFKADKACTIKVNGWYCDVVIRG